MLKISFCAAALLVSLFLSVIGDSRMTSSISSSNYRNEAGPYNQAEQMQKTGSEGVRPKRNTSDNDENGENEKILPILRFAIEKSGCSPGEIKNEGCDRCKCAGEGRGWICTVGCAEHHKNHEN